MTRQGPCQECKHMIIRRPSKMMRSIIERRCGHPRRELHETDMVTGVESVHMPACSDHNGRGQCRLFEREGDPPRREPLITERPVAIKIFAIAIFVTAVAVALAGFIWAVTL